MMKNNSVSTYRQEFNEEIVASNVDVSNLLNAKITNKTLAKEVYLRELFGDEIYKSTQKDGIIDDSQKQIEKLDVSDLAFDEKVRELSENIADEKFDANVELIIARTAEDEEE